MDVDYSLYDSQLLGCRPHDIQKQNTDWYRNSYFSGEAGHRVFIGMDSDSGCCHWTVFGKIGTWEKKKPGDNILII